MRFSPAIVFVVVAALTSSISAMPTDDGSLLARLDQCSTFCVRDSQCIGCAKGYCVSISSLRSGLSHMTHRHGRPPSFANKFAELTDVLASKQCFLPLDSSNRDLRILVEGSFVNLCYL
ncbi:uncharacterized protein BJ212DRAFT_567010 [Suillus subaureus]|uniref:Uncharacterized protein n=1 Tax=Suillus subaureus TaxID=48587 RepID=A0A9P7ASV4_9AGAM|nr:uncharacterized protein BJ212DRAFT_567010 [Suillus subaureus]KAG1795826.1 hypothetical protein BJ212DRAFT_567010 [Suillus subaureus]